MIVGFFIFIAVLASLIYMARMLVRIVLLLGFIIVLAASGALPPLPKSTLPNQPETLPGTQCPAGQWTC